MNICIIGMPFHLLTFSLPKDCGNGARPKDMSQLTKHVEVKPARSNHAAAEFTPTDNLRSHSKIAPLEISTTKEFLPDEDLSPGSLSPSSKDATNRSNGAIGPRQSRDAQGEKRNIKMAVRHRRVVTTSAEGGASKNDRAARSDYSSDDSEEENVVMAMKRSLYKMPKMSGNIFFVCLQQDRISSSFPNIMSLSLMSCNLNVVRC